MSIQSTDYQKSNYGVMKAMGAKAISSDASLQIDGFETMWMLCKQFPHPVVGVSSEIEIPGPNGSVMYQPAQIKTNWSGPATFSETEVGHVEGFLIDLIANGGTFNAWIYEGTPDRFSARRRILDAFFQPDSPDRDWENRTQVLNISGTMFYHYFGQVEPGNVEALTSVF